MWIGVQTGPRSEVTRFRGAPLIKRFMQPSGFPAGGIGMLLAETVVRIRREHSSGMSIEVIARDLRLSREWCERRYGR